MPTHARAASGGGGPGSGPGLGSLPGLVLFESGLTGMGPLRSGFKPPANGPAPRQLRLLGRTIATVRSEPLQRFDPTVATDVERVRWRVV